MSFTPVASKITKSSNAVEVYKGQSKDLQISITQDGLDLATGKPSDEVPVPLNGATVYFSVRKRPGDPICLIKKVSTNSGEITIATPTTLGVANIHLIPLDTYKLDADTYVFDVWVVLGSGETYPVIEVSEFIVKEPVTIIIG